MASPDDPDLDPDPGSTEIPPEHAREAPRELPAELPAPFEPPPRRTPLDLLPRPLFGVLVVLFLLVPLVDVAILQNPLPLSSVVLLVDVILLDVALYLLGRYFKRSFYPTFMAHLNLPVPVKREYDARIFRPRAYVGTFLCVYCPAVIVPFLLIGVTASTPLVGTVSFFAFGTSGGLLLFILAEHFCFGGFMNVVNAFKYRKHLQFRVFHPDGMGGTKQVIELYLKKIYPFFLLIPLLLTMFFQVFVGESAPFGLALNYEVFVVGLLVLSLGFCLGIVFLFQVLMAFQMRAFKKARGAEVGSLLQAEIGQFRAQHPDSLVDRWAAPLSNAKGAPEQARAETSNPPRGAPLALAPLLELHFTRAQIARMSPWLINSGVMKKLLISVLGVVVSYAFNIVIQLLS